MTAAAIAPGAARHAPGARVTVIDVDVPGHIRTPQYVRGRSGVIERVVGAFRNPEELAYGRSGEPRRVLYRVRFLQRDIWPDYTGAAIDTIDVDLYEHWLRGA
jgi:nitrile hydratase subunit beta